MITKEKLTELLRCKSENEHLEFKEMKNEISITGGDKKQRKSLLGYVVALANEGGGKIILGVADKVPAGEKIRRVVGTQALRNSEEAKRLIFNTINLRIDIEEVDIEGKRVVVITVPSRPAGVALRFFGVPLMRIGESLEEMDDQTLRSIIMETASDYSSEVVEGITLDDLDLEAISKLKKLWAEKSGATEYLTYTSEKLLSKLLLVRGKQVTVAGVLLLGKSEIIGQYLPQSEFIFEWRTQPGKIDFDFKKVWRKPFLTIFEDIWEVIHARNVRTPFKQGFIESDIWAYDRNSVREAILNAFAHREYRNRVEPVFIKLSPEKCMVKSPGGFLPGVSAENALFVEGRWRNRLLMEVLHEIGLVERSGVGLDRIFMTSISSGKGAPQLEETSDGFVQLELPAPVKDIAFVSYLEKVSAEKQIVFNEIEDLIEVEHIRETGKYLDKKRLERFLTSTIVEKTGKGTGTKYFLSRKYYEQAGKKGEYTRKKGLHNDTRLELLRSFFHDNAFGTMDDLRDVFDGTLDRKQIQYLLKQLKEKGEVYFDPSPSKQKGVWRITA
ncbi:MAG: RNA-binding domain-containing protein [Candidatus Dojkabacteria bacterium]